VDSAKENVQGTENAVPYWKVPIFRDIDFFDGRGLVTNVFVMLISRVFMDFWTRPFVLEPCASSREPVDQAFWQVGLPTVVKV
jgi:hypothetical protein